MTDIIPLLRHYKAAKDDLESYAFMPATDKTLTAYNGAVGIVHAIRRKLRKEIRNAFGEGGMMYWENDLDKHWDLHRQSKYKKVKSINDAWQAYTGGKNMNSTWTSAPATGDVMLDQVNRQLAVMIQAAQTTSNNITNYIVPTTSSVTNCVTNVTTPSVVISGTAGLNGTLMQGRSYISSTSDGWDDNAQDFVRRLKVGLGHKQVITLPDDTVIEVEKDGSYKIVDTDAKVKYKANPTRDFNTYVNASDKIEEFIRFCGKSGVKQDEMLKLPLELFIYFLVIESAKADKEDEPDLPLMPRLLTVAKPRCSGCGRFLARKLQAAGLMFDRALCYERKLACV